MNTPKVLFLYLLLIPLAVVSSQDCLRIALGENKPPYAITSPPSGIEFDILTMVVAGMGMKADIKFIPNTRALEMLKYGELDAAVGNSGEFLSDPYISYENVAISLASSKIELQTITELGNYQIVAFQNAKLYLGAEFAQMAQTNKGYREISPQILINRQLYSSRAPVAISDLNIFLNLNNQLDTSFNIKQPLKIHRLFSPTQYRLVFNSPGYREAFNISLKKVVASNPFPALAQKYLPSGSVITFKPQGM